VQNTKVVNEAQNQIDEKPLLNAKQIGDLGFDLALFGVTPLQCVIGCK